MALIKCPECGKDISDKSEKCINCGFPIRTIYYLHENINGKDYDLSFLLDKSISQIEKIKQLKEITGCDIFVAKEMVLRYSPSTTQQNISDKDIVKCPKCGSTSISTGARGVNYIWGFIGASKTVNRCANCGHTWKP